MSPNARKPYRIVAGFDLTDLGERVVEEALDLARRHYPSEVHIITVAAPFGAKLALPGDWLATTDEDARQRVRLRIGSVVERYQRGHGWAGLERIPVYVVAATSARDTGRLIVNLGRAVEADLLVVGTHGRTGISRALLGSVAAEVMRRSGTSVLVVRPSDFLNGEKVPMIEPPLAAGEANLRPFEHRRTYHYVDKVAASPSRMMPVS